MNSWTLILGIGGIVLVWLIAKWLYFDPVERDFEDFTRECLDRQAKKRNGTIAVSRGRPVLTVPNHTTNIELAVIRHDDDPSREYSYARFRTAAFADKNITIMLNSKELLLKPLVIGSRVDVPDEVFREKYVVVANDPNFLNDLLTQEIRDELLKHSLQVKFGRRTDSSTLSRERGWLSVFTQGLRASDEVLCD